MPKLKPLGSMKSNMMGNVKTMPMKPKMGTNGLSEALKEPADMSKPGKKMPMPMDVTKVTTE